MKRFSYIYIEISRKIGDYFFLEGKGCIEEKGERKLATLFLLFKGEFEEDSHRSCAELFCVTSQLTDLSGYSTLHASLMATRSPVMNIGKQGN